MEELIKQLQWMLNLPISATADDIVAELEKLKTIINSGRSTEEALTCDLAGLIQSGRTTIAALTNAAPDPAKFVSIDTMTALQGQVAALTSQLNTGRLEIVVTEALASGKLLPSMEAWAREFGAKDIAALTAYVAAAPNIAILSGTQTGGKGVPTNVAALTAEQIKVCAATGISQEAFLATLNAEAQA